MLIRPTFFYPVVLVSYCERSGVLRPAVVNSLNTSDGKHALRILVSGVYASRYSADYVLTLGPPEPVVDLVLGRDCRRPLCLGFPIYPK